MTAYFTTMASPIGPLLLTASGGGLTGLYTSGHRRFAARDAGWKSDRAPFTEAVRQIDEYFAGERRRFDLVLDRAGGGFELVVWRALDEIRFGETATYGELAKRLGKPGAARAVGAANGRNPISIVVPCHRVVAANGSLTGYAGGLAAKRRLLAHEAAVVRSGAWALTMQAP